MKLSTDEIKTAIAACDAAMASTTSVVQRWKYQNLRTKYERVLRSRSGQDETQGSK